MAKLLKKRLFSSPEAFYVTLIQHEKALSAARRHTSVTRRPGEGILRSRIEQFEEEHDDDAALDDATNAALDVAAPLFREPMIRCAPSIIAEKTFPCMRPPVTLAGSSPKHHASAVTGTWIVPCSF